ncbi:outer membrane beta-barrel protein [Microbulbifer thermotolerans]|uniref:Outer membrane beta-barrel protein n=1 Tax=Microbulbifer thermotolerans TaxID=252514 RepID=A0AB35HVL8_MICTH|nr:outer membrane beta-barrel protein [Microbulbifer thermotolerans]MCX2783798.1 outer membrane beta-barrel protein [Microbulbifer thermotolerans]MCX2794122.1 outer membrane beta-barrel protein [Microbulbifer thermotolerans]MCX2801613.1 outer membrane beta-barrel protein [Microbulbifer thermotolerans]MCX2830682.1 outer membrane beta-barrel protein [Microbulbifer thermotolerans]WKT60492.1 outer membrane beta-barrel protein [Microbulbifer thermotolerans]
MTKRRQLFPFPLSVLLLSCLCSAGAWADLAGTATLYLNGGKYWFDGDRLDGTPFKGLELENTTGGGVGYGFMITDRWAMEGVVDYFSVSVKDIDEKVDVYNYHLDLFYQFGGQFCGNFCWQPYVAFGAGEIRVDFDDSADNTYDWHDRQTMVNLGLGVKYRLGPRWQARADARAFQGVEEGGLDGFVSLAIGYQWSEYPLGWRDTDADGVFDEMDQCPQTPPGTPVGGDGCPVDSDRDGVPNYLDQCPTTPFGTAVDESGCPR